MLHTMLRVRDVDVSPDFYQRICGMRLLRRMDFSEGRFTLAFVG
ncbi:VOC family protein [Massilia sp. CCM 9210]|nr:VOC family protein [Massilia sp. CCM 9210]MDQ1814088.1 VOC family protein [Massilia sp. CCM 9210]